MNKKAMVRTAGLENPDVASSGVKYPNKNKLNQFADSGDLTTMTKKINGGTIGLEDRIKHYDHAVEILT